MAPWQPSATSTAVKWLGFVTAIWVQSISGNNYTFPNYSAPLKSLMNLTQLQLNNLSVAKDVGKAFGLLAGLASDKLPPPVILLIGSVEGFIGYGTQWLVVSQRIKPLPYWQMCVFLCMGGNSTTWMNTAVLVTCIRNFRKNRGPVSGILKGYVGLSTAIFTDLCSALFSDSPPNFLLMLSIVPFVVCLTAILCLREVPPAATYDEEKEELEYFQMFNAVAVVVAVYLLLYNVTGIHGRPFSLIFSIILLVLLASPLAIPLHSFFRGSGLKKLEKIPNLTMEIRIDEPLLAEITEEKDKLVIGEVVQKLAPVIGEDHTIFEAMRTADFWILFVSFLCGVGTGLAVMNNTGQIGLALGYSDISIFVSITSIFGFFGRIISGTGSEYLIKECGTPRPLFNAGSQIIVAVGFILMAIAVPGSLYIGCIVIGMCYGVRLAITVPTASELFGLKYYGLLYNILVLNLPLGSFLFSGLLAGYLYDAEATETAGGGNTCVGAHCYRLVFVVMAMASLLGFCLDVLLAVRTKGVYAKICAGKKSEKSKTVFHGR